MFLFHKDAFLSKLNKREGEKTKQLENDTIETGLTAAAVTYAENQKDEAAKLGGKLMEKRNLVVASKDNTTSKTKKSNKPKQRPQQLPTAKNKKRTSKKKNQVTEHPQELKGTRQVPKPQDEHGCQHCGIFDLKTLSKDDLKYYTKNGAWLEKKHALIVNKRNRLLRIGLWMLECS